MSNEGYREPVEALTAATREWQRAPGSLMAALRDRLSGERPVAAH